MKKLFVVLLGLFALVVNAQSSDLVVEIKGVKSAKGNIMISVFDSAKDFPHKGELKKVNVKAVEGNMSYTFKNLPNKVYAIAILHDENANGKMDIGMFGPKEDYGFSNNAKGFFSAPSFEKASFKHDGEKMVIRIK